MASVLRAGRSTAAALQARVAGHALLIHPKGEPDPQAVEFAAGLAQDDQHLLVVVDLPFGALDEAWPAVARLLAPRRGSLRLIFGRATPQEARRAGQAIADQLERLVLAPDGELLPTAGGGLFIPADHGAGWLRMRPGREPERDSQRFPKPLWEFSTLDRPWQTSEFGVAESVPSGVWVRSARPHGLLAAWRRLVDRLPSDRSVLTVVLGCPGGPAVPLADVVGVWDSVLPSVRSRVKFVHFGPVAVPGGEALGQALADVFDQSVTLWTDLPLGVGPLEDALPNWAPFVQALQYAPGSAGPPVLLGLRPPLPGVRQIGPTSYEYTATDVLEVVQSGLWMRPAAEPANSGEVRRIPAAPGYSALLYDRSAPDGGERMKALAEDLLWRLEPAARTLFRIAPADDAALAAPPGHQDAWSLPEPSTEPFLTAPGSTRPRPAHVAPWAVEAEASPAVEEGRRGRTASSSGQQGRALGSLAPDETPSPAVALPTTPAAPTPVTAPVLPQPRTQTFAPANALAAAAPSGLAGPTLAVPSPPPLTAAASAEPGVTTTEQAPAGLDARAGAQPPADPGTGTASQPPTGTGWVTPTPTPPPGPDQPATAHPATGPATGTTIQRPAGTGRATPTHTPPHAPHQDAAQPLANHGTSTTTQRPTGTGRATPTHTPPPGPGQAAATAQPAAVPAARPDATHALPAPATPAPPPVAFTPGVAPHPQGPRATRGLEPGATEPTGEPGRNEGSEATVPDTTAEPASSDGATPRGPLPASLPAIAPVVGPLGALDPPDEPEAGPDRPAAATSEAVRPVLPAIAGIRLESGAPGGPSLGPASAPHRADENAESGEPPEAVPEPAAQSVRVQPVPKESALALPPQQGVEQEREWVRRTFSAQYHAIAGSVSRVMSEAPGLRDGSRTAADALTDLVAVRLYLSGDGAEVDDAVRGATVGPHVPLARCIASGLRRLPSYRGAALVRARLTAAEWDWYHEGRRVTEWAFWTAWTGWRLAPEGAADLLVWSLTGRRTSLLDPAVPDRVVFLPGTAFKVLRADDSGPRPLLLLRELTAAEATEPEEARQADAPLDALALGVLDRAVEALGAATGGNSQESGEPAGPVLGTAPGLLGRARPTRAGAARRGANT
ncbi:hypothetical protein [Streptacidiphilus jiangxiensis]|uniref:Uncharacterized protein n=1 Tax=Streptacidiphilus jiangxiensis TaxID=235985 RepID=A0A1H7P7Q4_STRJI|nr:hypothetical protein [Streptacidiphilus jiangxiensis]SEL31117.1 hypothetical protein SAMN05414137_107234 [Streptacidiphilus jiangxiensis]